MFETGYIRTAAVTPELRVANTEFNTAHILSCAEEAVAQGAGIIVFPELALTSCTCADLFYQDALYQKNLEALKQVIDTSAALDAVLVIGFYYRCENNFYNCAAVIQKGNLMGIVPKMFLPNHGESYEARWFAPGLRIADSISTVPLFGEEIPFGHLIFTDPAHEVTFGVEIGEDLQVPITPGSRLCLNGAHIIVNPAAGTEAVGKAEDRRRLIQQQSSANVCGYVYASSGVYESTTDVVYGGHCVISEYGTMLAESERFERRSAVIYGDVDFERLRFERSKDHCLEACASRFTERDAYTCVYMEPLRVLTSEEALLRKIAPNPFLPSESSILNERCREIFRIQATGLAKRIEHAHAKTAVVGISGGLDSTLALLVCAETFKMLGKNPKEIIAVTMPGFGTSDRTHDNALTIMRMLGVDMREVPIGDAVLAHFKAIGHDPEVRDVTYENSQARERTQILMDIANETGGFVVGTGDLSEAALGWCTYNGDHMSMYGVNISIPKTVVSHVVGWVADHRLTGPEEIPDYSLDNAVLRSALHDIIDTPISPELLPPDKDGKITQKTEERVGPYILHDFFLFYTIRFGMRPRKLFYIAQQAFDGMFEPDYIKKWLREFYRRFFTQQYKRSCVPDGPKVGSVALSPRGDWRMPSDAEASIWLNETDNL